MKTVYVVMNAEFVHPGHINIIKVARELGEVTVGLATDEFAARYKRLPVMSFEQRKTIVENIRGVKLVIPQETLDLEPVLRALKPDYFVHGDDWKTGRLQTVRQQVIEVLSEWDGQLVEPAYTEGVSSTQLNAAIRWRGITPENRLRRFRRLLAYQPVVRILEVHDLLSGIIVDQAQVHLDGKPEEFDAMWLRDFTDSLCKGKPAFRSMDFTSRMNTVNEILDATTKPLIVEAGYGFPKDPFPFTVRTLERSGVAALVVVDDPDDVEAVARNITSAKNAQVSMDFSIIVRMNTMAPVRAEENPTLRAKTYIDAGADALIIPIEFGQDEQFLDFCRHYATFVNQAPLLVALPVDNLFDEQRWVEAGVKGIIYGDHLLRKAYHTMKQVAESLLLHITPVETERLGVFPDEIQHSRIDKPK